MALIKKSNGFGPFVYLLINSGRMICSGASGTASQVAPQVDQVFL